MNQADILKRIDDVLALDAEGAEELLSASVSLLSLVYGQESPQVQQLVSFLGKFGTTISGNWERHRISLMAEGALKNLKGEIEHGLTGSLKQQVTGEVLTDFIQLSRSALDERSDGAKNVAAVLAAAAFEDTIRRMGAAFAGVMGKDDLSDVLNKLKGAGVIQSPQFGIAQSYLSFRNHALHANWDKIERESIHSVLGFVEQLLLRHFA